MSNDGPRIPHPKDVMGVRTYVTEDGLEFRAHARDGSSVVIPADHLQAMATWSLAQRVQLVGVAVAPPQARTAPLSATERAVVENLRRKR